MHQCPGYYITLAQLGAVTEEALFSLNRTYQIYISQYIICTEIALRRFTYVIMCTRLVSSFFFKDESVLHSLKANGRVTLLLIVSKRLSCGGSGSICYKESILSLLLQSLCLDLVPIW